MIIMIQKDALEIMKMGENVFLTGEAGTGKTHVLNTYIKFLKAKNAAVGITASTGIAATHLDGVTLDSWSGLGIRDRISDQELKELSRKFHLRQRLQKAKVLIIDEISMIHGSRFDAYDRILKFIRNSDHPFGGLQVILSGDLFQLPPVSRNRQQIDFIFKSEAWQELDLRICYLSVPRRQTDKEFLRVLNSIRGNSVNQETLNVLNRTVNNLSDNRLTPTKLYTHNVDVDAINESELNNIKNEPHMYFMSSLGNDTLVSAMKKACLAPEKLVLKKGALVMFVRNNYEKGYVNGTLGKVVSFNSNGDPVVETYAHQEITVEPASWTVTDEDKIVAQLTQVPLRLAWAITVHKSQGMTLDAAQIDLSKSFVEGMGYVALSRVKSLSGLRLLGYNQMALKVNPEISEADKYLRELSADIVNNLHKMGFLKRWLKKRKFMYYLTS